MTHCQKRLLQQIFENRWTARDLLDFEPTQAIRLIEQGFLYSYQLGRVRFLWPTARGQRALKGVME